MTKQITVMCDLGKWRRVKCIGTYEKGFRPIEEVGVLPPERYMTMMNNKYWKKLGYNNHLRTDAFVSTTLFPYPKHEAARRAKQKQTLRRA